MNRLQLELLLATVGPCTTCTGLLLPCSLDLMITVMTSACDCRPAGLHEAAATLQAFSAILVCVTAVAMVLRMSHNHEQLHKSTNDSSQTWTGTNLGVQGTWLGSLLMPLDWGKSWQVCRH